MLEHVTVRGSVGERGVVAECVLCGNYLRRDEIALDELVDVMGDHLARNHPELRRAEGGAGG